MTKKAKKAIADPQTPVVCDKWRKGLCAVFATAVYCPHERAANAKPGECISHPLYESRQKLETMKDAGFDFMAYKTNDKTWLNAAWKAFEKEQARARS